MYQIQNAKTFVVFFFFSLERLLAEEAQEEDDPNFYITYLSLYTLDVNVRV